MTNYLKLFFLGISGSYLVIGNGKFLYDSMYIVNDNKIIVICHYFEIQGSTTFPLFWILNRNYHINNLPKNLIFYLSQKKKNSFKSCLAHQLLCFEHTVTIIESHFNIFHVVLFTWYSLKNLKRYTLPDMAYL